MGILASIVISESLPAAQGFPPTPGRARVSTGPLEAEAGRQRPGSQEAAEIRMFNRDRATVMVAA